MGVLSPNMLVSKGGSVLRGARLGGYVLLVEVGSVQPYRDIFSGERWLSCIHRYQIQDQREYQGVGGVLRGPGVGWNQGC